MDKVRKINIWCIFDNLNFYWKLKKRFELLGVKNKVLEKRKKCFLLFFYL